MDTPSIFFGADSRLRSGWRLAIFCVLFVLTYVLTAAIGVGLIQVSAIPPYSPIFFIINSVAILIPALLVGWICGRWLERLPFRTLGAWFTDGWFRHLILGLLFGIVTLLIAIGIAFAVGGLRFETNPVDYAVLAKSLAVSFVVFAVAAAGEEAVFRGYPLQTFARSGLAPIAIGLTSVIFGIGHVGNDNSTTISTINTILAGVWFSIGYLKTRDLWFVWGMHLMWNWMQGAFFGVEVSGMTNLVSSPLLREIDAGPIWLTGAAYGIEGGIVTTIAITVSTLVICFVPWLKPASLENSDT